MNFETTCQGIRTTGKNTGLKCIYKAKHKATNGKHYCGIHIKKNTIETTSPICDGVRTTGKNTGLKCIYKAKHKATNGKHYCGIHIKKT
jgi:hypothetical protein